MEMVGIDWTIVDNNLMYKIKIPVGFSEINQIEVTMRTISNFIIFFYREKRTLE